MVTATMKLIIILFYGFICVQHIFYVIFYQKRCVHLKYLQYANFQTRKNQKICNKILHEKNSQLESHFNETIDSV